MEPDYPDSGELEVTMCMSSREKRIEDIVVVPEPSHQILNQRQLEDYYGFRANLIRWLVNLGKDPEKATGYAHETVRQRCYKLDQFYRWIWNEEGGYTLTVTKLVD